VIRNIAVKVCEGGKGEMRQHLDLVPEDKAAWNDTLLRRSRWYLGSTPGSGKNDEYCEALTVPAP
jgi:hypothetical protein